MGPEADFDVAGFGALNMDIIFKVPSWEASGLEPGTETVGSPDEMDPLMERLLALGGPAPAVSAGGSAANTVFALGRLGLSTGYVGAVGDDAEATALAEGLGLGMHLGLVRRGRSGRTVVAVGPDGDRSIVVFPGANDELGPADVDHLVLARARVLHLSAFSGDHPLSAQVEAVRRLPRDIKVSLDPGSLYARRGAEAIEPILARTDLVLPGEGELLLLTGQRRRDAAAQRLLDMGVGTVVCKLGPRGIHTYWEGGDFQLRARPVAVRGDSVGAGDVADAGYIAGWVLGLPTEACTAIAHACAVESLSGVGREAYPDATIIEGFKEGLGR